MSHGVDIRQQLTWQTCRQQKQQQPPIHFILNFPVNESLSFWVNVYFGKVHFCFLLDMKPEERPQMCGTPFLLSRKTIWPDNIPSKSLSLHGIALFWDCMQQWLSAEGQKMAAVKEIEKMPNSNGTFTGEAERHLRLCSLHVHYQEILLEESNGAICKWSGWL